MPTTTHKIICPAGEYTNVSNGNLNCALFVKFNQLFRVHVGGVQPEADIEEWVSAGGEHDEYQGHRLALKIANLAAEDEVYIQPMGEYEETIMVIRGEATSA